jgi:hypothetical protein
MVNASVISRTHGETDENLFFADAYSVSNGFTTLGTHPQGSHFHSTNLDDLPAGNPSIPVFNVAEVGGFFGDEEVRGLAEFDLQGRDIATQANLFFDVYDVSAIGIEPIGGLFGQDAYVGTIDVLGYRGNGLEEVSDYQFAPVVPLLSFDVDALQAGDTIDVDITALYNELVLDLRNNPATAAKALGIRLQVPSAVDPSDPNTGAITFHDFRILAIPEPPGSAFLLLGLAAFLACTHRRGQLR